LSLPHCRADPGLAALHGKARFLLASTANVVVILDASV